jgi:hypothetical protein
LGVMMPVKQCHLWSISAMCIMQGRPVCSSLWSSSQVAWTLTSGGSVGALLVSPFNVKWECYAQAGGVEGSKFCLFSVVFPVKCISSISPRFYFRRHAFCFLPLAAILESLLFIISCGIHLCLCL